MGPSVDQIEQHIEDQREDLRANLEELGRKVKSAVDWRATFRANPGAALALAFGGGLVIAKLWGASGARRAPELPTLRRPGSLSPAVPDQRGRALRAWDDIQSALLGVVAEKVARTLGELVPGFTRQIVDKDDEDRIVDERLARH
jgi:hypothetical protein